MKIRCEKIHIFDAVNTVMKAVPNKSNLPVLEGILLKAKGSVLKMIGNDTSLSIETVIPIVCEEEGEAVINAKILFEMIRKLPNGTVELSIDEKLNAVLSGQNSVYKMLALSSEDFPAVTLVAKEQFISLPSDTLKMMIRSTLFAVSTDATRMILNGSLFEVENGELHVVSLDGFRLAVRNEKVEEGKEFKFIVPSKALSELTKVLPDNQEKVEISVSKKYALFNFGNTKLVTRLIEGEFFNYRKSIPAEGKIFITLPTAIMKESIERVDPIINAIDHKNPIRFHIDNNKIDIDCQTTTGVVHDSIDIDPCGEELFISFNHRFFQDAIRACESEEIILEFNSQNSPCLIHPAEGNDFWYLILPVRS